MDAQDFRSLQEAYLDVYTELDEAEGSYGQTPKAHADFASLAAKRQQKPASQYPQRGAKTKAVASAEKHTERSKPTPAHRGRGPMDDESREYSREKSEVYSGGGVSDKGGTVTKNPKKLRKQKAMGEIGEQVDVYDIILSHLLDEGYAETVEAAEVIMVNMSEDWRQDIMEISQRTATRAYAASKTGEFEGADSDRDIRRTDNLEKHIKRKFGDKAVKHAERAADAQTFGRKDASGRRKQTPQPRIQKSDYRTTQDGKMHKQDQKELKTELRIKRDRRLRAARAADTED
jgi:hypothetical protein